MQIRKYALGGFNYIPLTSIEQAQAEQAAQQKAASSAPAAKKAEKASEVAKDALDMIKTHGLESDVNAFLDDWQNVLAMANDPNGENINLQQVIAMQRRAVKVKNNYDNFKQATENLSAQDAWQDVAVTSTGQLYVTKDGKLTTMSMEEYSKGDHSASVITNQYLAELRESRPEFKYNMDIINDLKNAVGFNKVIDQAMKIVNAFGTTEQSAYTTKEGSKIAKGLEKLIGDGPDGVYKVTTKAQLTADRDTQAALNYLYKALPIAYRWTLSAYSAAQGGKPGSQDDLMILAQMIQRNVNDSVSVNYEKTPTDDAKKGSGKGSGESSTMKEQTLGEAYQNWAGWGNGSYTPIARSNLGTQMNVFTIDMGNLMRDKEHPMSDANLEDTLRNSREFAAQLDLSSISFGDIHVDSSQFDTLVIDSDKGLKGIVAPYTIDDQGNMSVDFALIEKVDTLNKQITPGMTVGQKKGLVENDPRLRYNEATDKIEAKQTARFMVLSGYTSDDVFGDKRSLVGSNWLKAASNAEDKSLIDEYNQLVKYKGTDSSGNKQLKTDNKATWLWGYKFYKGNIFIPMKEGTQSLSLYSGQEHVKSDYLDTDRKRAAYDLRKAQSDAIHDAEKQGRKFTL